VRGRSQGVLIPSESGKRSDITWQNGRNGPMS